jgi:uncharacterized cupin superfamily protein
MTAIYGPADLGASMSQHLVIANPATIELAPSPFPQARLLDGHPQAKATSIARSQDGAMMVIAWSCTKGRFRWHYHVDEMAHILSGEVFITDQSGTERRLGPGDTVFFPSGSTSLWQVTADVRKIAVCRVAVPRLVALGLRVWNTLRAIAANVLGLDAEAGLTADPLRQAGSVSAAPRA